MEHAVDTAEMTATRTGRNRGQHTAPNEGPVVLGPRDSLVGTLTVDGDVRVHGTVEGELKAAGDVTVEETATVKARIEGRTVAVRGTVQGNVTGRRRLILAGSGSITGDVRVAKLQVEDGATLNGNVTMTSEK